MCYKLNIEWIGFHIDDRVFVCECLAPASLKQLIYHGGDIGGLSFCLVANIHSVIRTTVQK